MRHSPSVSIIPQLSISRKHLLSSRPESPPEIPVTTGRNHQSESSVVCRSMEPHVVSMPVSGRRGPAIMATHICVRASGVVARE